MTSSMDRRNYGIPQNIAGQPVRRFRTEKFQPDLTHDSTDFNITT
jgi:hypothetical protein